MYGVWVFFLCIHLCTMCMPGACRGQKRVLDHLELELQRVVNHHVDAGNQTQFLCKSNKCSSLLSHLNRSLMFSFSITNIGRVGLRAGDAGYGVRMWAVVTTWKGWREGPMAECRRTNRIKRPIVEWLTLLAPLFSDSIIRLEVPV